MGKRKPLKVCDLVIKADTFEVIITEPDDVLADDEDGRFSGDDYKIRLHEGRPVGTMGHTYFHEICHGGLYDLSEKERCEIFRCTPDELDEREEMLIGPFSESLYAILDRNSYLKLPKFPKRRVRRQKVEDPSSATSRELGSETGTGRKTDTGAE